MTKSEAIEFYGGNVSAVARAAKVDQSTVYSWGEFPPYLRQCLIERASKGKLRATLPAAANSKQHAARA
jgi:hypothetical protein